MQVESDSGPASLAPDRPAAAHACLNDARLIAWLCVIASLRIFVFSAAFPLFNIVDEAQHFDLVRHYAEGHVPSRLEPMGPTSARYILLFRSPEYESPGDPEVGKFRPPLWARPADAANTRWELKGWGHINYESSQPPVYYTVAAVWLWLGRLAGLPANGFLVYWLRFLNCALGALLVWLGAVTARRIFPDRRFVRLAVPTLLAFYPQDTFYSIQSDVLSPLCFGAAFLALVELWRSDLPFAPIRLALAAGLALAATGLVKATNLPLVALAAAATLAWAWNRKRAGTLRTAMPALGVLAAVTTLPLLAWFAWNARSFGDLLATAAKTQYLGWTPKPFSAWWDHPLFSLRGAGTFLSELIATFWRGELRWHGDVMSTPAVDLFYCVSSVLFVAFAVASVGPHASADRQERRHVRLALATFLLMVVFFAGMSLAYDFGQCPSPSRQHPYFVAGRLLTPTLVPFLLLYTRGLDWVLAAKPAERMRWLALAGIVLVLVISEIVVTAPVFTSQYNFFHLSLRAGMNVTDP